MTLSSVNHNFATELGSSAKLKVSGLIYFGDPLFASGQQTVTKCMGESRELTRKPHTKGNEASPLACSLAVALLARIGGLDRKLVKSSQFGLNFLTH